MRTVLNTSRSIYEGITTIGKKFKPKGFDSLFESHIAQTRSLCSAMSTGTEKAEQVILREHGLSEILSESIHKPTIIGQTPVHSPILLKPEPKIEVLGHTIKCPKGRNGYYTKYEVIESEDKLEKFVKFYDDNGNCATSMIPLDNTNRTSKMTKKEYEQWLADINKNGFRRLRNVRASSQISSLESSCLENTIKGLKEPKGTVEKMIRLDEDGNTIVRFLNKEGSFLRKVIINQNGKVLEYSNYRTLLSSTGIKKDAQLSRRFVSCPLEEEFSFAEFPYPFEEQYSNYMRIREESRYILDLRGEVVRTIQTRKFTPHEYGRIGDTSLVTTVDARSVGNGGFIEDVVIINGDKRFERTFWFDQKTGSVHAMDGWCKGFTKEEIELIKSDPFLASRFYNDGLDFVRVEKFNAYKTQGLRDKQTQLTFEVPESPTEGGHYQHYNSSGTTRHINMTPDHIINGKRSRVVNTEHHEPRHGFQHQMEEDLKAGLLDGEEKTQAEIFANNFANYKHPKTHGYAAYWGQPVEVDARHYGEAAQRQFEEFGEKENHIFFNA